MPRKGPAPRRELMPDPEVFAMCVRDSFQEYLAAATALKKPATRRKAAATPSIKPEKLVKPVKPAKRTEPVKPARAPRPPAPSSGRRPRPSPAA